VKHDRNSISEADSILDRVRSLKDRHGRLPATSCRKWRISAPHIRPKARRDERNQHHFADM
jgi:hypothetical protein